MCLLITSNMTFLDEAVNKLPFAERRLTPNMTFEHWNTAAHVNVPAVQFDW